MRQFHEWGNCDQGRHILIAVVRYLAAHFPTQRALLQTTDIASRLMRGGELHRKAQAAEQAPGEAIRSSPGRSRFANRYYRRHRVLIFAPVFVDRSTPRFRHDGLIGVRVKTQADPRARHL